MWVWSKLSAVKWADAWEERFYGHEGCVISEIKGGKSVRVTVYCESKTEAEGIQKEFGGSIRELKNENWVAQGIEKAKVKKPIMIRDAVVVTLEGEVSAVKKLKAEYEGRHVISIPPEMAFGTGDHPTTATCLRFLVDVSRSLEGKKWDLLDLGTGSGVLAIAGKLMGAGEVRAIDYDEKAVEVTDRNVKRNVAKKDAHEVQAELGDVFTMTSRKSYEVVVANLFSDILIEAFPRMAKWLKKGGRLIVSGILYEQWEQVKKAGESEGLELQRFVKKGKWVAAEFDKE